jgi:TldD protein
MAMRTRSASPSFEAKVKLLQEIDAYVRDKDPRVRQVTASIAASWQVVDILRADGQRYARHPPDDAHQHLRRRRRGRPAGKRLLRLWRPRGFGDSSRASTTGSTAADEALRQALVNLEAIPAPAGTMDVVLGLRLAGRDAA